MKIRNGFVSNSSSSSFIVIGNTSNNIEKDCRDMINLNYPQLDETQRNELICMLINNIQGALKMPVLEYIALSKTLLTNADCISDEECSKIVNDLFARSCKDRVFLQSAIFSFGDTDLYNTLQENKESLVYCLEFGSDSDNDVSLEWELTHFNKIGKVSARSDFEKWTLPNGWKYLFRME